MGQVHALTRHCTEIISELESERIATSTDRPQKGSLKWPGGENTYRFIYINYLRAMTSAAQVCYATITSPATGKEWLSHVI
jgi:hypothetical protein